MINKMMPTQEGLTQLLKRDERTHSLTTCPVSVSMQYMRSRCCWFRARICASCLWSRSWRGREEEREEGGRVGRVREREGAFEKEKGR